MRCLVLVLVLAAGGDALLGPPIGSRTGAPSKVLRPPIHVAHTAVVMGVGTDAQRSALNAAKEDGAVESSANTAGLGVFGPFAKRFKLKSFAKGVGVTGVLFVFYNKVLKPWLAIHGRSVLQGQLNLVSAVFGALTGPTAQSLGVILLTRLMDYVVPVAFVIFVAAMVMGGGDEEPSEADRDGVLSKLLRLGRPKKLDAAPAKEYIKIQSLTEKLSSMEYTVTASTTSTAEASRSQRRLNLAHRFGDEIGEIGDAALAGVAKAEATWRKSSKASAAAALAARSEIRSISVKLGVEKEAQESRERKELEKKMGRAKKALAAAQKQSLELETAFLATASAALGNDAGEKRAALAKLVAAPVSWDPTDVPLPHNAGLHTGKRAFVLNFEGDIQPTQTSGLREEVTAVIRSANATRGDSVVLRLVSGGGSVTGYGLAMAQLLRIKEAGLHLTVCVEQVAASGGYMMACVADRIVASPFAVLGSIGVITQIPNVYERLNKEGVVFQTVTAGEFKRTLTPFKEIDQKDVEKTEQEIGEIFALFKGFVSKQRPALDIDKIATGETWFGEDAIERNLADKLQTYDDLLLELHTSGVKVYSITYKEPDQSPLAKLGIGGRTAAPVTSSWLKRVVAAAFGLPLGEPQTSPYSYAGDHISLG